MEGSFFIALIAACIHFILSILVSCALKNSKDSKDDYIVQIKKLFNQYRDMLFLSSFLVGIIVYMALYIAPIIVSESDGIKNLLKLGKCPPAIVASTFSDSNISIDSPMSMPGSP